jgi:hypothetical protein
MWFMKFIKCKFVYICKISEVVVIYWIYNNYTQQSVVFKT